MTVLESRLQPLEATALSYDDDVDAVREVALDRVNNILDPILQEILSVRSLGLVFTANSPGVNGIFVGLQTFVITDDAAKQRFVPTALVACVANDDATQFVTGIAKSYDRDTGELVVQVTAAFGAGNHTGFVIYPATCVVIPAVIDPGTLEHPSVTTPGVTLAADGIGTF